MILFYFFSSSSSQLLNNLDDYDIHFEYKKKKNTQKKGYQNNMNIAYRGAMSVAPSKTKQNNTVMNEHCQHFLFIYLFIYF